ncbi:hypothetical protein [Sinomonas sp. P10A9]|uniref:LPXTG-motif cell wall-anchored protein n=1 Tax=Sinomonas puerhi TaxID=3238584 RepID=A0AB39KZT5_9MICC
MSTNFKAQHEYPRGPSVGTIVWGAVLVVTAALIIAGRVGWLSVDPGVAAVVLLLIAGLGLVVGGALAGARRRRTVGTTSGAAVGTAAGGAERTIREDAPSSDDARSGDGQPTRSPYATDIRPSDPKTHQDGPAV